MHTILINLWVMCNKDEGWLGEFKRTGKGGSARGGVDEATSNITSYIPRLYTYTVECVCIKHSTTYL